MTRSVVTLVCVVVFFAASAFALVETPAAPLELTRVAGTLPEVAFDGENFFAVWTDQRDPRRPAIYGARITPDREVLDPVGVRLMEGSDVVSIASGLGHTFILGKSLRYVIVDRDAKVVARGGVADETTADRAQVVFNGDDFVAFWSNPALRTATLDPFGGVVRWPDNVVSDQPVLLHSAATDGARILVTYTNVNTLYVAATSLVGERMWADKVLAKWVGFWTPASIASAGGTFAVTWLSELGVHTMRVDADGNAIAPWRVAIPWRATTRIVATSDGFRLFEAQELRVMSYTLTEELAPVTVVPVIDIARPETVRTFAVADGPRGPMVVADLASLNPAEEVGLYAASGDTQEAPLLVSRAGTTQYEPDVALGDDGMLVAWRERERPRVAATFFASDGSTKTFDVAPNGVRPSVAAQGDAYCIAWITTAGARARVLRDGQWIGGEIVLTEFAGSIISVASDGRDFVVATSTPHTVAPIQLSRISIDGRVVARASVAPVASSARVPLVSLACDDAECLLAWVEQKPNVPGCFSLKCLIFEQVLAVHLDAALAPRYASPVALTEPAANVRANALDVAAEDGAYAVAWEINGSVSARTVGRGQQLGTTVTMAGKKPVVERAGNGWLLVRESGTQLVTAFFTEDELRGGVALANDVQWRSAPALARIGAAIFIAYERTTIGEDAGGVMRAYVSRLAQPAPKRRSARN